MKILTRDDTEHGVEYVIRADAEREIEAWKSKCDIIHAKMSEMERLLRQVLPDYADEVAHSNGGKVCAEITEKDVVMIRDFLANAEVIHGEKGVSKP